MINITSLIPSFRFLITLFKGVGHVFNQFPYIIFNHENIIFKKSKTRDISNKRIYPCDECGKLRSGDEGGTVFTVCDECWEAHYSKNIISKNLAH